MLYTYYLAYGDRHVTRQFGDTRQFGTFHWYTQKVLYGIPTIFLFLL